MRETAMATNVEGARAPRLLVVDDATIMRMRIAGIAREAGWDVVAEATNGREGLARYAELPKNLLECQNVLFADGHARLEGEHRRPAHEFRGARERRHACRFLEQSERLDHGRIGVFAGR